MKPKILIVDDEKPTRDVMARILAAKYDCQTAPDGEQALKLLAATPDLALLITDYRMPGMNGVELIKKAKAANPALACIVITAFGEIDLAVDAMKEGADDFLTKPVTDINQLELRVAKALKTNALERKVEELESRLDARRGLEAFTGRSPAMERVYTLIRKVAPTGANVLVTGPSGTGKELVARAIHDLSPRAAGPFVAVECSALPATLLETELFGSTKGAYTDARDRAGCFETADGGTLFLDEIGEIDAAVQVKLLRVLETHTFARVGESATRRSDFRLVAATNKDLARLVGEGTFREDLYYRLNVIALTLPALKDRPGDIALLVSRFIREFAAANGGAVTGIDHAALSALEAYPWPGNVRQLRNVIERMVVLSSGGPLTLADVPDEIREGSRVQGLGSRDQGLGSRDQGLGSRVQGLGSREEGVGIRDQGLGTGEGQEVPRPFRDGRGDCPQSPVASTPNPSLLMDKERDAVVAALEAAKGNVTAAAAKLGVSRRTLHRRINAWGLK